MIRTTISATDADCFIPCSFIHRSVGIRLPAILCPPPSELALPCNRRAASTPIVVAALHWSATAVAAKSAFETDSDANTDPAINGALGGPDGLALDITSSGGGAFGLEVSTRLSPRYIDSLVVGRATF